MSEDTTDAQAPDEEGLPGSQVVFAGGNVFALAATALGGALMWIVAGIAAAVVAVVASRRRSASRSSRSSGTRSSGRSLGKLGSGRTGSRSAGRTGAARTGGSSGRTGKGRSGPVGRLLGRAGTGRGKSGSARTGLPGRGNRTAASGRTGGKKGASRTGKGPAARSGRWPFGRTASGAGRTGRGPSGRKTGGTRPGATGRRPGQQGRKPASRGLWPSWFAPAGRKTVKKPAGRPAAKKTTARPISRPTAPGPGPVTPPTGGRPNVASPTTTPQAHPYRNQPATGTDQEGAPRVFGRKWKENAEEVRSQAARYDPDAMPEYLTDCKDLTEAFEVEADAIGKFAAVSESDLPVHPDLAAYIRSVQSLLRKVSEESSEVVAHFQKLHEEDLKRHQAPRPNEAKWNVK